MKRNDYELITAALKLPFFLCTGQLELFLFPEVNVLRARHIDLIRKTSKCNIEID